jgi:hypothetical protein
MKKLLFFILLTTSLFAQERMGLFKAPYYTKIETQTLVSDSAMLMLRKANNLSDLSNKTTARTNLQVYSTSSMDIYLGAKQDTAYLSGLTSRVQTQLNSKLASTTFVAHRDSLGKHRLVSDSDSSLTTLLSSLKIKQLDQVMRDSLIFFRSLFNADQDTLQGHRTELNTLNSHRTNTSNPHSVTASQVSLGNLTNKLQVEVEDSNTTASGGYITKTHLLANHYTESEVNGLVGAKADTARTITAGNGLSGGGSLGANRTLTANLNYAGGLEFSSDSIKIDLDGSTLVLSDDGISVNAIPISKVTGAQDSLTAKLNRGEATTLLGTKAASVHAHVISDVTALSDTLTNKINRAEVYSANRTQDSLYVKINRNETYSANAVDALLSTINDTTAVKLNRTEAYSANAIDGLLSTINDTTATKLNRSEAYSANAIDGLLGAKADTSNVLKKNGTKAFYPTAIWQPTTKNYVDSMVVAAGGYTDEAAQDAVGNILDTTPNQDVDFVYDDGTPTISGIVRKIQGIGVSNVDPTDGQVLTFDTDSSLVRWLDPAGGTVGIGDVTNLQDTLTTKLNRSEVNALLVQESEVSTAKFNANKIMDYDISTVNPTSGQVLTYNSDSTKAKWTTPTSPVILTAVKTADETVNNSSTYQDDDHLFVTVAANTTYIIDCFFVINNESVDNQGMKIKIILPSGASISGQGMSSNTDLTFKVDGQTPTSTTLNAQTNSYIGNGMAYYNGSLFIASTGGAITIQWAQAYAHASNLELLTGSYLRLTKVQ